MKQKIALIDADVIIYRIGFASQSTVQFDDAEPLVVCEDIEIAKAQADTVIQDIVRASGAKTFRLSLSGKRNFRKTVDPTYKLMRKETSKPIHFAALREHLERTYDPIIIEPLEADDVCGIMATDEALKDKWDIIVVSEDKDLLQIPGTNYNPRTQVFTTVTPESGYRFHMFQTLAGDRVDNYPGCPGIGEVKASKILSNAPDGDLWGAVVQTYQSKGLTEEDALLQARLSCILHAHMYDKNTKQISLFQPKQRC